MTEHIQQQVGDSLDGCCCLPLPSCRMLECDVCVWCGVVWCGVVWQFHMWMVHPLPTDSIHILSRWWHNEWQNSTNTENNHIPGVIKIVSIHRNWSRWLWYFSSFEELVYVMLCCIYYDYILEWVYNIFFDSFAESILLMYIFLIKIGRCGSSQARNLNLSSWQHTQLAWYYRI